VRGVERDNKESGPKGPGLGLPKGAAQGLSTGPALASSRQRAAGSKKIKVSMFL